MISDIDEIPNPEKLKNLTLIKKICCFFSKNVSNKNKFQNRLK